VGWVRLRRICPRVLLKRPWQAVACPCHTPLYPDGRETGGSADGHLERRPSVVKSEVLSERSQPPRAGRCRLAGRAARDACGTLPDGQAGVPAVRCRRGRQGCLRYVAGGAGRSACGTLPEGQARMPAVRKRNRLPGIRVKVAAGTTNYSWKGQAIRRIRHPARTRAIDL